MMVRLGVHPLVELPHRLGKARIGLLVQIGHRDARGQFCVVGVVHVHVRGGLGGEVVELGSGHLS